MDNFTQSAYIPWQIYPKALFFSGDLKIVHFNLP